MLVLLIIFMVAAPMLQRGVEVNLPVGRQTQKLTDVRTYVTVPLTFRQDRRVMIDDESVPLDVLAERMRQAMIGKDQKEVFLRADGAVMTQELMDVMDRLREGGIERIGIVALERSNR
jgi:biopolymer transport protein ExbD